MKFLLLLLVSFITTTTHGQIVLKISDKVLVKATSSKDKNSFGESKGDLKITFKNKSLTYIVNSLNIDYDEIVFPSDNKSIQNYDVVITASSIDEMRKLKKETIASLINYSGYKKKSTTQIFKKKWMLKISDETKTNSFKQTKEFIGVSELIKNNQYRAYSISGEQLSKSLSNILRISIVNNIPKSKSVSLFINNINGEKISIIHDIKTNFGLEIKEENIQRRILIVK